MGRTLVFRPRYIPPENRFPEDATPAPSSSTGNASEHSFLYSAPVKTISKRPESQQLPIKRRPVPTATEMWASRMEKRLAVVQRALATARDIGAMPKEKRSAAQQYFMEQLRLNESLLRQDNLRSDAAVSMAERSLKALDDPHVVHVRQMPKWANPSANGARMPCAPPSTPVNAHAPPVWLSTNMPYTSPPAPSVDLAKNVTVKAPRGSREPSRASSSTSLAMGADGSA
tara:strand:+ start:147 stop:833 length:687 start_codon:yes stop_codon:yes gene_type:complete